MMNLKTLLLTACITTIGVLSADQASAKNSDVNTIIVSELFGYSLGQHLKSQDTPLDKDALIRGIINGFEGGPLPVCEQDGEKVLEKLQEKDLSAVKEKMMKKWKKITKTAG